MGKYFISVISTQIINLLLQRKQPQSITVYILFSAVCHQAFRQVCPQPFTQLDCDCEKGGSSDLSCL